MDLDDASFVTLLYRAVLGRDPDPAGYAGHLARLRTHEISHEKLTSEFLCSTEFNAVNKNLLSDRTDQGYSAQDLSIFNLFTPMEVKPSRGFVTDFIGSRARVSSLWKGCESLDNTVLPVPVPSDYHADAIEWIGTLKSVLAATGRFAVMELGAGHGPWIAASSKAAQLRGIKSIAVCGVEADPGRFALMRQNIVDNEMTAYDVTLVQAAVGVAAGVASWPRLDDPANDSGARPLRYCSPDHNDHEVDLMYLAGRVNGTIDVEVVALGTLLAQRPLWDLVHIDIQGTEVELCRAFLDELSTRVRYMVIGTHSRKIDGDLMELLVCGGWDLEHEKPARFFFRHGECILERMTTHDGAQVWRNPRL
jgi:FkbM family methyltransferase